MWALFDCVGRAVVNKGARGLADLVPGAGYLVDVVGEAFRLFRERRRDAAIKADVADDLRGEIALTAAAGADEAKRVAREVAARVAGGATDEERVTLELYLTQVPAALRQSLKRSDDPAGKTVPADLPLGTPDDLLKLLPHRVPQFRPGAGLPGRFGWTLTDLLGAGGFGEVWLAEHTFIPHRRAVKFCTDPVARAKLTSHEGKIIARVMAQGEHPNVVPLLDAALDGDAPWLMFEYVGGGSLSDLVHAWQALPGPDREGRAVAALAELAAAVGTFHRLAPPIVHRDLKPSNILLSGSGDRGPGLDGRPGVASPIPGTRSPIPVLRITDFGIGGVAVDHMRTQSPRGLSLMTGWLETSLRGSYTPLYASPQQRAGSPPDPRDDVHALGVIGYQMMTGRLDQAPGIDAAEDLQDAGAGPGLIALLTKCVAQKPDRRPKDAAELAEKLAGLRGAGATTPAAHAPDPPKPPPPAKTPGADAPGSPKPPKPQPKPAFAPGPLEGGTLTITPKSQAPAADATGSPKPPPPPLPPAPKPTRHAVAVAGQWFSRPAGNGDAAWSAQPVRLPGEVAVRPTEAYRLAVNPAASDAELAKLTGLAAVAGLEAVDLSGCAAVTDAGVAHLAAVPGLKAVGLAETGVSDAGVALLLSRFPDLEAVSLAGAERVSAAVVPYLARMRKLKFLALPPRADTVDVRVELARKLPACQFG